MDMQAWGNLQHRITALFDPAHDAHTCERRIKVTLVDDRLILDGEVIDISSKRLAANIARQMAHDTCRVIDRLRVGSADVDDRTLVDRVFAALSDESVFAGFGIRVRDVARTKSRRQAAQRSDTIDAIVSHGVVRLRGRAASAVHARLAEARIWGVQGCRRVDNRIEMATPTTDADAELGHAVRKALEMDPLIGDRVEVDIADGVIELRGSLPNEMQARRAVLDAWAVPGVWRICDRIAVDGEMA